MHKSYRKTPEDEDQAEQHGSSIKKESEIKVSFQLRTLFVLILLISFAWASISNFS